MNNEQERAVVFVDGSNFYNRMKDADINPSGLNYALLSQKLVLDRKLIETRFYIGRHKQTKGNEEAYNKQRRFLTGLEKQDNVKVCSGLLEIQEDGKLKEKTVDVMIAVDMVSMAYEEKYDVAYLLSVDGDFTPAVKKVRERERKVFVVSPIEKYKLAQAANTFILLNKKHFHGCWT